MTTLVISNTTIFTIILSIAIIIFVIISLYKGKNNDERNSKNRYL